MKITPILIVASFLVSAAAKAEDKDTCQPQPTCRIEFIDIKPGAPGTGLKPQAGPPEKGPGIVINGIRPDAPRDTYRLPIK